MDRLLTILFISIYEFSELSALGEQNNAKLGPRTGQPLSIVVTRLSWSFYASRSIRLESPEIITRWAEFAYNRS